MRHNGLSEYIHFHIFCATTYLHHPHLQKTRTHCTSYCILLHHLYNKVWLNFKPFEENLPPLSRLEQAIYKLVEGAILINNLISVFEKRN